MPICEVARLCGKPVAPGEAWMSAERHGDGVPMLMASGPDARKRLQEAVAAADLLTVCNKARSALQALKEWGKVPITLVDLAYGIHELDEAIAKAKP